MPQQPDPEPEPIEKLKVRLGEQIAELGRVRRLRENEDYQRVVASRLENGFQSAIDALLDHRLTTDELRAAQCRLIAVHHHKTMLEAIESALDRSIKAGQEAIRQHESGTGRVSSEIKPGEAEPAVHQIGGWFTQPPERNRPDPSTQ